MKPELQIKAIAELDGWTLKGTLGHSNYPAFIHNDGRKVATCNLPHYLTSRDAIVPVIEKQPLEVQHDIGERLQIYHAWKVTAEMYCQALLRATGKWVE
jgi:hypothetical protein